MLTRIKELRAKEERYQMYTEMMIQELRKVRLQLALELMRSKRKRKPHA